MENNSPLAARRQVETHLYSIHRYVEIGVVADRRFLDFHNNTDYEQYLLTIMNMVADFYHDSSVGNQIDIILVRMIYLEKEKEEVTREKVQKPYETCRLDQINERTKHDSATLRFTETRCCVLVDRSAHQPDGRGHVGEFLEMGGEGEPEG